MKNFLRNIKKYKSYMFYSAKASLLADVSGSYLNRLWWILDPLCFMLVYTFVHNVVFHSKEEHFVTFIFCGYGAWQFFNRCVMESVRLVRGNKSVLSRVYLPKYILLGSSIIDNFYRYLISIGLTIIAAILEGVKVTPYLLLFPLIVLLMILFTFAICVIVLHAGVYFKDLGNILRVLLRLMFYMSGVFYNLRTRVPVYGVWICRINPMAMFINEIRNVVVYATAPEYITLVCYAVISITLLTIGIHLVHKYEQTYIKAV